MVAALPLTLKGHSCTPTGVGCGGETTLAGVIRTYRHFCGIVPNKVQHSRCRCRAAQGHGAVACYCSRIDQSPLRITGRTPRITLLM